MKFEQLQKDMMAAMKARDKVRKDALSALVSAAKKVAIDENCRDNISEEIVDRVILKEIKSVKEQLDTCPDAREDLKQEYQARYDIFLRRNLRKFFHNKCLNLLCGHHLGRILLKNVVPCLILLL